MKTMKKLIIAILPILLIPFFISVFLGNQRDDLPTKMPSDFGIVFTYGYMQAPAYSGIDTINGSITKDLVMDGVVQDEFKISKDALENIYQRLHDVHITRYPSEYRTFFGDVFRLGAQRHVTPRMAYSLKIYNGETLVHSVNWEDSSLSVSLKAAALRKCLLEIIGIIESTDEYKNLPEKRGAYA